MHPDTPPPDETMRDSLQLLLTATLLALSVVLVAAGITWWTWGPIASSPAVVESPALSLWMVLFGVLG